MSLSAVAAAKHLWNKQDTASRWMFLQQNDFLHDSSGVLLVVDYSMLLYTTSTTAQTISWLRHKREWWGRKQLCMHLVLRLLPFLLHFSRFFQLKKLKKRCRNRFLTHTLSSLFSPCSSDDETSRGSCMLQGITVAPLMLNQCWSSVPVRMCLFPCESGLFWCLPFFLWSSCVNVWVTSFILSLSSPIILSYPYFRNPHHHHPHIVLTQNHVYLLFPLKSEELREKKKEISNVFKWNLSTRFSPRFLNFLESLLFWDSSFLREKKVITWSPNSLTLFIKRQKKQCVVSQSVLVCVLEPGIFQKERRERFLMMHFTFFRSFSPSLHPKEKVPSER